MVIVKFMHFVNNRQYPVQPVALYVTEHNACRRGGWGSVYINSNVKLNCIKFHFVSVCFIRVVVYDNIVTVLTFTVIYSQLIATVCTLVCMHSVIAGIT